MQQDREELTCIDEEVNAALVLRLGHITDRPAATAECRDNLKHFVSELQTASYLAATTRLLQHSPCTVANL